jgi:hypothetical protein
MKRTVVCVIMADLVTQVSYTGRTLHVSGVFSIYCAFASAPRE